METVIHYRGATRHPISRFTTASTLALALCTPGAFAAQDDLHVGLSVVGSQLQPETSNSRYTITDDNDTGLKLFIGYDLRDFFGLEASVIDFGEATLGGPSTGAMGYEAWNLSGRFYYPFRQDFGPRAFLKAGFGDLDVSSDNLDFTEKTGIQTSAGIGVEWPLRNHFAIRAEYDYFKADAQALSLGISKHFSLGKPRPAPVADSDGDGIADASDHCADTPAGTAVLPNGCPETRPVQKLAPPQDSDGDGIQDSSDTCPGTFKGLMVDLKGCPADADGDGIADGVDQCANTPAGSSVASNGCRNAPQPAPVAAPTDSDGDGVDDAVDRCPNTLANTTVDSRGCGTRTPLRSGVLDGVQFVSGSILLTEASKQTLRQVAASLNQQPDSRVMVVGHTDSIGSTDFNFQLSTKRARAVAAFLAAQGVHGKRLRFMGKGEEVPIADNASAAGRAKNRRVVVIVSR